jgi:hypothetical protein
MKYEFFVRPRFATGRSTDRWESGMPKRLLERRQPESIAEFRASATARYEEALSLSTQGYRTGAIYLWGYAAEMILKAAYFRLIGRAYADVLAMPGDINAAIANGIALGIAWPPHGRGHNVRAWSEFLVVKRATLPGAAYPTAFGRRVQQSGQTIGQLWNETLRYHKNVAYPHEVRQIRYSVEWLLTNSHAL